MTKRQFSLLLGLVGQAGCIVYDDAIHREGADAAIDVRRDSPVVSRDAAAEGGRSDTPILDVEASRDANLEAGSAADSATAEDVVGVIDAIDAAAGDAQRDAPAPIPDAPPPDAPLVDAFVDVAVDMPIDIDGRVVSSDAPFDASNDPPIVGCSVDFTVSGVTWDEDAKAEDGGARSVRLVGDIGPLGGWVPEAGRAMMEKAPGAWSTSVVLSDSVAIELKFVKVLTGRTPEWEQWLPFDSNRSFLVNCGAEGGTVWVDASTEAGPVNRAVGRSYGGAFGVRPLDATK